MLLNPSGAASGWSGNLLHGDHARRPHPPRQVTGSGSRTAYRKANESPAGVRSSSSTQKGSTTQTSSAHQMLGHFILHMELMTTTIKCLSLLLKRNLMGPTEVEKKEMAPRLLLATSGDLGRQEGRIIFC